MADLSFGVAKFVDLTEQAMNSNWREIAEKEIWSKIASGIETKLNHKHCYNIETHPTSLKETTFDGKKITGLNRVVQVYRIKYVGEVD